MLTRRMRVIRRFDARFAAGSSLDRERGFGAHEWRNEELKGAAVSDMKTTPKKARVLSQKPLRREFTVRDMNRSGAEL